MQSRLFLGRYEAIKLLGEGGMGKVYLARQTDLLRQVVVKVMHEHIANDLKFRDRFQRETDVMARFQHQYCVTLYDASLNDPNGPCIVMEYVKGVNLETLFQKNGKFTPARVGRVVGQLCEVMQAAHDDGIIHRDLKPANLMVIDGDTPRERIKVMDFGLAKLKDEGTTPTVTDTAIDFAVGTPGYIAPEQIRGERMDHRGDLYSIGAMMFELMAGRLPFVGSNSMDVLLAHATEPPPRFADLGLGEWIPDGVENLVRMCLEKDPDKRPQSAKELGVRFAEALGLRKPKYTLQNHVSVEDMPVSVMMNHPPGLEAESDIIPLTATLDRPMPSKVPGHSSLAPGKAMTRAATTINNLNTPGEGSMGVSTLTPVPREQSGFANDAPRDPNTLPFSMDAWMPESIAIMKLKGFCNDYGGEVLGTKDGIVRVKIGRSANASGALTWLGLNRRGGPLDVELHFIRPDPKKENYHTIHVLFRPATLTLLNDRAWRQRCTSLFVDLRAYFMGG
jgi:eukaryotic-like serine/threonine-protein kinase